MASVPQPPKAPSRSSSYAAGIEGGSSAGAMLASTPRYGCPVAAASWCASASTGVKAAVITCARLACAASSTLPPPPPSAAETSAAAAWKARCSSPEFSVPMAKPAPLGPSPADAAGKYGMQRCWQLKDTPNRKVAPALPPSKPWMAAASWRASRCPMPGCQLRGRAGKGAGALVGPWGVGGGGQAVMRGGQQASCASSCQISSRTRRSSWCSR